MPRSAKIRLIDCARHRFGRDGYAATPTEAIIADAGVRRGALYHHFTDKAALFAAVHAELADEAMVAVETSIGDTSAARLEAAAIAWTGLLRRPDARQILIIDGSSVLGRGPDTSWLEPMIEDAGLAQPGGITLAAQMLGAAFAALSDQQKTPADGWRSAVLQLLGLFQGRTYGSEKPLPEPVRAGEPMIASFDYLRMLARGGARVTS